MYGWEREERKALRVDFPFSSSEKQEENEQTKHMRGDAEISPAGYVTECSHFKTLTWSSLLSVDLLLPFKYVHSLQCFQPVISCYPFSFFPESFFISIFTPVLKKKKYL